MQQFAQARMGKKRFWSQLVYCLRFPPQAQVQRLDKSLIPLLLWFEKEQLSFLFQQWSPFRKMVKSESCN